jgi:hypothetical protein
MDTRTFSINVISQLVVRRLLIAGQDVALFWDAVPGRKYRVQYKPTLAERTWSDLPGDIVAVSGMAAQADTLVTQRFYRVIALP